MPARMQPRNNCASPICRSKVAAARARSEEAKARYEQSQRDLKANVDGPIKQDC